jgi:phenylpropionate dioxygenase-like ring-hydroxylating dioxygenase large terminal subunit
MEGWIALSRTNTISSKPKQVILRNKKFATYRHNNAIILIPDECQHRGMTLSKGKVLIDGKLECPYHGWTYDKEGWYQPNNNVCGYHEDWFKYKTRVQDGLLWIQPQNLNDSLKHPPAVPYINSKDFETIWFETIIQAPAQFILENGIDPNHASWVHANPLGFGTYKEKPTNFKKMRILYHLIIFQIKMR